MVSFRLATYENDNGPRAGLIVKERVYDLAELAGRSNWSTTLQVLEDWQTNEAFLENIASVASPNKGRPINEVRLLAPLLHPPAVYCAGANYANHVTNMERKLGLPPGPDPRAAGGRPFHFLKASRCCIGPDASVRAPSRMLDWEGELVAVIGVEARKVSVANALSHVAGYTIGNDLSARDLGIRTQLPPTSIFYHSFLDHKSFEASAPIGPWIVPARDIPDPSKLMLRTEVNGVTKQCDSTAGMIFTLQEQIAYLSSVAPLYPGDIIMTGTPAGVGAETGEYLSSGDRVTVTIGGIGSLTTNIT